ncbi:MAG: GntR family transcriptional regulator [Acidimicrobiales bacterium]
MLGGLLPEGAGWSTVGQSTIRKAKALMVLQRPETMTEAVRKYIRDAIVRGDFAPGARLPEIALANSLNTSRGTVREALRMLADRGLIDVIPHRGVFVSQLSPRATWEITSLRALLEPYAARLALESSGSSKSYQEEVRSAYDRLCQATTTTDPLAVADADVAFHRAVFVGCDHQMLLDRLETLQTLSRRLVLTNQLIAADASSLVAQHEPIATAVEHRDPDRLEAAVRAHVIEAGELLLGRMSAGAAEHARGHRSKPGGSRDRSWPTGSTAAQERPRLPSG